MAYAQVDTNNRIIKWSYESLKGFPVYFSNPEYLDEKCINGAEDFIIENGIATFSPAPEKEIFYLKEKLAATDYIVTKIAEGVATKEEYAEQLANRQSWRERINELSEF